MMEPEPRYRWEMRRQEYERLEARLVAIAGLVGFHVPGREGVGGGKPDYEPTPDEIRTACAEIRRGWGPTERQNRAGAYRRVQFVVREVKVPF